VGAGPSSSLAATWNGTTWTTVSTADPAGSTDARLDGVSCASASFCLAVGSYDNASSHQVTLAESWNGTHWTLHRPPALPGTKASELVAVNCTQSQACTAVGDSTATGQSNASPLSERWNGTSWMVQPISLPPGAQSGSLVGVSCPLLLNCTAVGTAGTAALAELYS
jgi:hypothetical protein